MYHLSALKITIYRHIYIYYYIAKAPDYAHIKISYALINYYALDDANLICRMVQLYIERPVAMS